MGQYTVKHQCDRTCGTCKFRVVDIYIDSFDEHTDQYCKKDNRTVSEHMNACELWREDNDNER